MKDTEQSKNIINQQEEIESPETEAIISTINKDNDKSLMQILVKEVSTKFAKIIDEDHNIESRDALKQIIKEFYTVNQDKLSKSSEKEEIDKLLNNDDLLFKIITAYDEIRWSLEKEREMLYMRTHRMDDPNKKSEEEQKIYCNSTEGSKIILSYVTMLVNTLNRELPAENIVMYKTHIRPAHHNLFTVTAAGLDMIGLASWHKLERAKIRYRDPELDTHVTNVFQAIAKICYVEKERFNEILNGRLQLTYIEPQEFLIPDYEKDIIGTLCTSLVREYNDYLQEKVKAHGLTEWDEVRSNAYTGPEQIEDKHKVPVPQIMEKGEEKKEETANKNWLSSLSPNISSFASERIAEAKNWKDRFINNKEDKKQVEKLVKGKKKSRTDSRGLVLKELDLAKDLHKALRESNEAEINKLLSSGVNPYLRTEDKKSIFRLIKQDGERSFVFKIPNYFLAFIFRIAAYKSYNKVRDYVYAYNLAETRINKQTETKLSLMLKQVSKEGIGSLEQVMSNIKLGKNYTSEYINKNPQIVTEYTEFAAKLNYQTNSNWDKLAKIMREDIDAKSVDSKREARAKEVGKILNNTRAKEKKEPTYSKKALEDANWNGYRNIGWVKYAISFIARVSEYIEYNKLREKRDAYNVDMEQKIGKALDKNIVDTDANVINEHNKAIIEEAKVKYNEGNVKVKVPFTHLSICGTGALKQKIAVKSVKSKLIEGKYQENWGEYIRNSYDHGQDNVKNFMSRAANALNPKNYFFKGR